MKRSKFFVLIVALVMLFSGCAGKKSQAPEPYQDLFTGGSFDENKVWTTDDERYIDLVSELSEKCENRFEGNLNLNPVEGVFIPIQIIIYGPLS